MSDSRKVEILGENTGEIRVYVVQYWSQRRQRRVREYADAVPEVDILAMSPEDQASVRFHAAENLRPSSRAAGVCAPSACASCKSGCSR